MNRTFCAVLCGLLLLAPVTASAEPQKLIFSYVTSSDTPTGKLVALFKKLVERKLDDRYTIEIVPEGRLMDDAQAVDAVASGEIAFAVPPVSKFGDYTQQLKVFDLPFLFPDMGAVNRFEQGPVGQQLLESMSGKGIVGLGYLHNGAKQLTANKPFHTPSDLAGLSFRIMNSDVLRKQFERLGATPVPLPFPEVYQALADDRIQGQENTWSNIYSKRFYEHQPYMMESNHGMLEGMLITNAGFWNGLSEEERRHFRYAAHMALEYGNAMSLAKGANDREALLSMKSVDIYQPGATELAQWREVMEPLWDEYRSAVGADVLQAAQAAGN
ncbi:DctP family TRAP transporter solute-binding subunit [Marinobacter sp. JSM 1782161]|uniref:DctP family TRAP transporter solute-binding subunit n=1 Tax=Marinobacter sp. JSM 1782161 TaxID=2685906 RepID=UPI001402ADE7|nr:DctP family TRAP transporter solute-binding subunit [Marinobacter sp. JSM 1782161]